MHDEQIAHLAGVMDAAGTITVHIQPRDNYSIGYEFRPLIRIKRPESDAAIIGKLDEYAAQHDAEVHLEETDLGYELEVYGADNIEAFLEPMWEHLVAKYDAAHIMLKAIVPSVRNNDHLEKRGFYELMGAVDTLRYNINSGPDPKYTQEYFADEFGMS